MIDLKITGHDLTIVDQDLALVVGAEATAQHAAMRLQTFLAESPYDRSAGVPWLQVLLRRGTARSVIDATLAGVVAATPGVVSVDSVDLTYSETTVSGTISATVQDASESVTVTVGIGL